MDNLTVVTSVHYSDDIWEKRKSILDRLQPGDKFDLAGKTLTVIGEKGGRVEVDIVDQKTGERDRGTVDPMYITNIRI